MRKTHLLREVHLSYCGLDDYELIGAPSVAIQSRIGQDIERLLHQLDIPYQWQHEQLVLGDQVIPMEAVTPDVKREVLQVILREYGG